MVLGSFFCAVRILRVLSALVCGRESCTGIVQALFPFKRAFFFADRYKAYILAATT